MREGIFGTTIITLGVIALTFIFVFQKITNTDEELYNLLRETTEAAMYDSVDLDYYNSTGSLKIDAEKFIENFLRRFAENASLANTYRIRIYDINELPPKVTLSVSSSVTGNSGKENITFTLNDKLSAILETTY